MFSLFGVLRSAIHTVQPIELNFSDSPADGSGGNTIQISMDCITMHEPEETFTVSAHAFISQGNLTFMASVHGFNVQRRSLPTVSLTADI